MLNIDDMMELYIENVKKLFFPEEWINLDLKFSKSEIFTMLYLDKRKEITMSELVDYINSPMSTATGIADRLVKNGYVLRGRSETDRRIVILKLTDEGSRLVKQFKDMILGYINMITEDLSEEEEKFLVQIIFKIMDKVKTKIIPQMGDKQSISTIKEIEIE